MQVHRKYPLLILIILCLLFALAACEEPPQPTQPPTDPPTEPTEPVLEAGWFQQDGKTYYRLDDGTLATGWLELEAGRYYLKPDGSLAQGQLEIDGISYFFTANGEPFLMVNPWKPISQDYAPETLIRLDGKIGYSSISVSAECYDALVAMLADCNAQSGSSGYVISAYRDYATQTINFNRKLNQFLLQGYSQQEAYEKASQIVAPPGTSEHHTGLAVDIVDVTYGVLDKKQESTKAQKWLMENSWRYGFTLRYPVEKTDVTGIIYEPWHYRYVGTELAKELYDSDLCLEEYFQKLTTDN